MNTARKITGEDLAAVDAIMSAYMACNDATGPLEYERTPDISADPSAMGYIATAGRTAWKQLGLPSELWDTMVECGENAAYVLNGRSFCTTCEGWRTIAIACDVLAPRGNYTYGPCPDCDDGYAN